ncbi:MAG: hypothetical protein V7L19_20250 [Nostoc sp.]
MGKLAQKWEQWTRDFSGGGREWEVGDACGVLVRQFLKGTQSPD